MRKTNLSLHGDESTEKDRLEDDVSPRQENVYVPDTGRGVNFEGGRRQGRVPPQSLDSEEALLGGVLVDNEALNQAVEILRPDDFYKRNHQCIFAAMILLYERREPIDVITLSSALRSLGNYEQAGGVEYLSHLVDAVPSSANTEFYAKVIKEMSVRRKLIHVVNQIATDAMNTKAGIDSFLDSVEQKIFSVSDSRITPSFARVGDIVKDSMKRIDYLVSHKFQISGVPSGFIDLDHMTFGFQPADLVIIAGRPSMGKTSLALSIVRHVGLDCGRRVAVFSLEMSKEQIVMRLLCSEARVGNARVRSGKLSDNDYPRLVEAASKIAQADILVDDTPAISVLEMRAKCRRLHKESPLSLIVVDYLQLMRGSSNFERRDQEISEISASLKALAKELSIPVIALSQLNRAVESRQDKRPIMADLRESGAIEQDADIIGLVYRDEVYNPDTQDKGVAELIIAKHRNGPVGTVRLGFQAEHTLFVNLEEEASGYDYLGRDLTLGAAEEDELI